MEKEEILEYTQEVAKALGESDEKPIRQIELMVEHIGRDFVQAQLDETKKIEENGGMKTDDGKRRRTKGGVFFYIAKGKMDNEVRAKIFPNFGQAGKVVEWEERHEYVDNLLDEAEHGNMRYVNITLHGRPGKVVQEDNSVITTISHIHKKTPLPKGVPHPPEDATIYTVYMSRKHWSAVEETINEYKNDRLIIEGTIFLDNDTETISVHATSVTTRRLEKQTKKGDPDSSDKPSAQKSGDSEDAGSDGSTELQRLHKAADKLRKRIAEMEAKGQRGVNMTKELLRNTERQIEALEKN